MARSKKRSDGLYQKQIIVGRNANGTYKRVSIYGKTQRELEEKITALNHELKIGLRIDADATFREMANIWLNNYRAKTDTAWAITQRGVVERHLIPSIGNISVKKLTKFDLQTLINRMRDHGAATSTMKKVRDMATQILEVAMDKKLILRNPFNNVTVASIPPNERRFLTDAEVDLISGTWREHRMGYAALIMLYCGLCRGEMMALDWSDLDYVNKVVMVRKAVTEVRGRPHIKGPKSEAGIRDVPIPDFLVDIFKAAPKPYPLICPSASGELMTDSAYKRAWHSYEHYLNIKAGGRDASRSRPKVVMLDHITAHMLRHTYASLLYEAGVDVKSAQKFLGHSDIETTLEIYTHLTKQKEEEAVRNLNDHFCNHVFARKPRERTQNEAR